MQRKLTDRQEEILEYIAKCIRENPAPPTVGELANALQMSSPSMLQHLQALERKGVISREPGRSRSIRLLQSTQGDGAVRDVPIVGKVAAGLPVYAEEHHQGTVRVDAARFRGERLFGLRVKGRSMINAGIFPKDLLIVRQGPEAASGDIVVAMVGDEATVKRLRRRGREVTLMPENDDYEPIMVTPETLVIVGRVVGVLRFYEEG
ncbi:MAG: transcriptional repressor LexA [Deltaproteobacteria bacterium]|nr:transcriptional repressor LexA [Deltaproteobacteria bacterium]